VSGKRQKSQMKLAFAVGGEGEAFETLHEGTEPLTAQRGTESPASTERLMEEVLGAENLKKALKRVKANKGSPGIDGMTVDQLPGYLKKHWPTHRTQLLSGSYRPQAVKRVEIAKPGGGKRKLSVPTVLDRFIQQAVLQVLQGKWDGTFSESSFGFRPGRSAHQAVAAAQKFVAEGHGWVVDIDLEKFFDRVNHDMLMARVARRVADKRLLKLIRAFLNAGVMENGLESPSVEGTPQGGPLSPLLSNLLLDDLDKELEKRGHRFVRYADDCNIHVRSERAGIRVMGSVKAFLIRKLKLKVNESKSAVGKTGERKFLGFRFSAGRQLKRAIAPQALVRFKRRVAELTRRTRGVLLEKMVSELTPYLTGWRNYFGFCQTPSVLRDLDSWIRRRLRCVVWKQWKRGTNRFAQLRACGVRKDLAARTAGSPHGPWRISRSPALSFALPNVCFDSLGLPKLLARVTP
jgi:RNA-directed DNA polymerase